MAKYAPPTKAQMEKLRALYAGEPAPEGTEVDPRVEKLVEDLIGAVADKWTMLILETLVDAGWMRFTRLYDSINGISQKMLTQTLRRMERDGLIERKIYPVVPPRVEYRLTELGLTLGAAFCGVWVWAVENLTKIDAARGKFDRAAKRRG